MPLADITIDDVVLARVSEYFQGMVVQAWFLRSRTGLSFLNSATVNPASAVFTNYTTIFHCVLPARLVGSPSTRYNPPRLTPLSPQLAPSAI